MSKRAEYTYALYSGRLADVGDANPYAGGSPLLAKLWLKGYSHMLSVVTAESGPAMQTDLWARAAADK